MNTERTKTMAEVSAHYIIEKIQEDRDPDFLKDEQTKDMVERAAFTIGTHFSNTLIKEISPVTLSSMVVMLAQLKEPAQVPYLSRLLDFTQYRLKDDLNKALVAQMHTALKE